MYQTNSFDKLATTPYVSKYVGNTLQEQAQTLERLQGRYDAGLALENQMTRIVNSIPFDKAEEHLRQPMLEHYNSKLQEYAQTGDYHRNLSKIQNDAAMIESYYKTAASRAELAQKQREAVMKTKAPDAVKQMYASRVITPGSKFTPAGFQFSAINPNLPADFIDVEKEALDRADEIKKVSQEFGRYLTTDEKAAMLRQIGVEPSEALLKQLSETETRDPKAVMAVITNALASNPQWNEVLVQDAQASVFGLGEEDVDRLLMQKYPPEFLIEMDLQSKKGILAKEVFEEKKQGIINTVMASKAGTHKYKLTFNVQNIPGGTGGGGGSPHNPDGLNFTGNDKAFLNESWSMESHVSSIVSSLQSLTGPNAPKGQAYAVVDQQNKANIATLKNVLTDFANSPAKKNFVENGLALDVKAGGYGPTDYYEVIGNQKAVLEFYKAAKSAGIPGFESTPMRVSKTDDKTEVVDWDAAVTRILNNYDISWSNTSSGDRKRLQLADATDSLFAKDDKLGGALSQYVRGDKKEVATTVRTMQGGSYDDINAHYTRRVKANAPDFSIVSSGSLDGKPVFGDTIEEFIGGLKAADYDVANYEVRFLETNPLSDRPTYALVVPGKVNKLGLKIPDRVEIIASGNVGETAPDVIKFMEEKANKLESSAEQINEFGDPIFKQESQTREYTRLRFEVVSSLYSSQLGQLNMFRAADNAKDVTLIYPVPAEKAEGGFIKILVDKTEDRNNSGTSDYIYTAHMLKPGQSKGSALRIQAASPEELLYRIHQDVKQAPTN